MHLPILKLLARRHPPVPLVYLCKILKSEVDWVNNMCLIFFSSCVQTDRCTRGISDTLKIDYSGSILAKDHGSILLINL